MPLESDKKTFDEEYASFCKEFAALMSGTKVAAARSRKHLMNMAKLAKTLRADITTKVKQI